jgi:hypothetical protein
MNHLLLHPFHVTNETGGEVKRYARKSQLLLERPDNAAHRCVDVDTSSWFNGPQDCISTDWEMSLSEDMAMHR